MKFRRSSDEARIRRDPSRTAPNKLAGIVNEAVKRTLPRPGRGGSSGGVPELPFRIAWYRGGRGAIRITGFIAQCARSDSALTVLSMDCRCLTFGLNVKVFPEAPPQREAQYATMASLLPMPHETLRSPVSVAGACFG